MRYDPDIHHRRTIRLNGWDYSRAGAYFVTICSWKKECIFIDEGIKQIACNEWKAISRNYPEVRLDEFVLMPTHLHAIIWIENSGKAKNKAVNLGKIILRFKSKRPLFLVSPSFPRRRESNLKTTRKNGCPINTSGMTSGRSKQRPYVKQDTPVLNINHTS